ncbi:hypothetical protein HG263_05465 [Pseudoalteromonas sp. JBTF-M23]|uniref:Uncharacterized protein n=1 Tax=Pseudoalteromonas caenipelagi TaxID=2726988 RepID=A0A849VDH5_9GAMM|nr:hypothetical protein [Pseudoalteromonas caenipelagi]NOU49984.1 hypothetical protein [Pseudoalteromonas caenipelagi]
MSNEANQKAAREGFSTAYNGLLTSVSKLGGNAYNLLHSEHRDELLKNVQTSLTELKKAGVAFDEALKPASTKDK